MSVVAVVAVYDPGPGLADLVADVLPQVSRLVVVDDGSIDGLDLIDRLSDRITLVRQDNAGVAAALNAGIALVLQGAAGPAGRDGSGGNDGDGRDDGDDADAVLSLDQDSRVPAGYVAAAVAAWHEAEARRIPVSAIAPASYSGHASPTMGRVSGFDVAFDPMQSGLLVPLATFRRVGLFDEGFVIDGVDSEFTVRCLAEGLVPVVAAECHLEHGQGERLPARLRGRPLSLRGQPLSYNRHSPDRVYYMARNGTVLVRRYARSEPRWVARRLAEEGRAHVLRVAFSPDRVDLLKAALAGVRDGSRGRTGRRT